MGDWDRAASRWRDMPGRRCGLWLWQHGRGLLRGRRSCRLLRGKVETVMVHCVWFGGWSDLGLGVGRVCDLVVGNGTGVEPGFHNVVMLVEVLACSPELGERDSSIEVRAMRSVDCTCRSSQIT